MATFIVLLGPPGVGKGTQAKILAERTGLVHISSGDLFRENMKNQTELGKLAQSYINKGELVPDDVTIAMIHDRLSSGLWSGRHFGWVSSYDGASGRARENAG
jgi:adenylate kinase